MVKQVRYEEGMSYTRLAWGGMSALGILGGHVLREGYGKQNNNPDLETAGEILHGIGWAGLAYTIASSGKFSTTMAGWHTTRGQVGISSIAIIWISKTIMNRFDDDKVPGWVKAIYTAGFVSLGASFGMDGKTALSNIASVRTLLGLAAAGLAAASTLHVLPVMERPGKITDGFGMPLFALSMGLLVLANSINPSAKELTKEAVDAFSEKYKVYLEDIRDGKVMPEDLKKMLVDDETMTAADKRKIEDYANKEALDAKKRNDRAARYRSIVPLRARAMDEMARV